MGATPSPPTADQPRHVAVIMDGNGRWAERRGLPRAAGHRAGVKAARVLVEHSVKRGVGTVTIFAFSSENWSRPAEEVGVLMQLFVEGLQREATDLIDNGVRVRFIGDRTTLPGRLQDGVGSVEERSAHNDRLELLVAVSYGGRWDIARAARRLAQDAREGLLDPAAISEDDIAARLSLGGVPDPDLFIRTGGERRISNFLLWNLAYTELYFCDTLWPDFGAPEYDAALAHFAGRERRFGRTSQQLRRG